MSKGLFRPKNDPAKFFSFRSHRLSKLLFSTIVALLVISTAHAAGPLQVNPANPRYFFDSNGSAVYLAGTYLRHEEIELGTSDFTNYLDFLQQQKHNFTRLWAWEQTPSTARNPLLTLAYERTGPGLALDGGAKFDLRRFNQNHFDQLRARVGQAAQRGVYVSVVLFQSLNATSKKDNPWYANPLNRDNNINGINGDTNGNGVGDEAFTLAIPAITTLQEAYIRKVVDTLNNLDNVLYEISADGPLGNLVWQNHIINYLKSYQATKLNQHPIGIGHLSGTNTEDVFASPADWITFYGADLNPPSAAGAKVLFLEANPSLLGDGSSYQSIWKYFTRGFNVIDRELDSLTPGISDRLHGAITQSLAYSQILNLAAMIPSDVICSSGYCLVKPGAEYLAYLPLGGRVVIDLSTAQQSFLVNWFNPITGQTVSGNTVSGGGQVTLTSPFNGEALLHLKIQPQALTSASTTTNTSDTSNVTTLSTSYSASTTSTGSKKTTVSTPTITPNGASFAGSTSVSLADATGGATIYYTTDGSSPTQSSPRYSGPITISSDVLLKAQAFKNNANPSSVASAWFAKTSAFDFSLGNSGNVSVVAGASVSNTISATLASGSTQALSFTVSGLPSGASGSFSSPTCNPSCSTVLAITTSGSTPAGNFPVTVTSTGGGVTRTTVFTLNVAAAVVSAVATPTITPNGGSFTNSVSVTLATATSGASIYYTTDGSSPTQSSKLYTGAMTLTASAVVKAKTFKSGYNPSAEASASFTSNLVAYWKFDEGTQTTAADSSGNGNTGTLTNGPLWTAGRIGNALFFDGIDDTVTVLDSNSLDLSGSFTLSAWVNPASTFTDFRSIIAKNDQYYLYASSTGFCGDGTPFGYGEIRPVVTVCQPTSLPANTWTYLTLTYNGSKLTLYRNGVAVSTVNASGTLPATTQTLQLGASQFGEYFKGLIDEVRIYKTALSDTEIQTIYQQESIGISSTVAAPLISPNGGSYSGSVSVAMQTATSGASIYYTTDGSTPTQSSILYNGSMALTSSKTVKAKAFKSGYNASTESDASFIVSQPFSFSLAASANQSVFAGASVSNTISATLDSGSSQAVSFSISGLPTGATASFSSPSCSPACSTILNIGTTASTPAGSFPITVTSSGGGVIKTATFTLTVSLALTVATPTITPNGGNFSGAVSVAMQTATSGASIYYTTDGSTPTQSSTLYTGTMALANSATVNAKAFKSGANPSSLASASFTNTGTGKTTYYVAKAGGSDSNSCAQAQDPNRPKATFGAGLQCMKGGDRLEIKQGTYEEDLYSAGIVPPSGTPTNHTVIATFGSDTVTFTRKSSLNFYSGGFSYVDFIGGCTSGINRTCKMIWDGTGSDNFDGGRIAGSNLAWGNTTHSHHLVFDGIRVTNWGVNGFNGPGPDTVVRNCRVDHNGIDQGTPQTGLAGYGFYIAGSNITIEYCEIDHQGGYGIHNNDQTNLNSNNIIVRYNIVHDNGLTTTKTNADGVLIGTGSNSKVYGNLVYNHSVGFGIRARYCNGCQIYNNTLYNNSAGVYVWSNSSNTVVKSNIVYGNSLAIVNDGVGTSMSNNLSTDPKFNSLTNYDFRLQSGSPAIDAGLTVTEVTTDIDGTPRPQGTAYDIGAYEYR